MLNEFPKKIVTLLDSEAFEQDFFLKIVSKHIFTARKKKLVSFSLFFLCLEKKTWPTLATRTFDFFIDQIWITKQE